MSAKNSFGMNAARTSVRMQDLSAQGGFMRQGIGNPLMCILMGCILALPTGMVAALNPAIEHFNQDIIFYLGFNEGIADADLAAGMAAPADVEGSLGFAPGIYGQALVLGGENGPSLNYHTAANIDLSSPGAFSFWMAPLAWIQRAEADRRDTLRFFNLRFARRGAMFIQRQGFSYVTRDDGSMSRRHDRFHVGVYALPDWDNVMHSSFFSQDWQTNDWKLIVVNWDRAGYSVSIDGEPAERREFSRFLETEDFPPQTTSGSGSVFTLGHGRASERTLMDEFIVFRRPLADDEIRALYEMYISD